MSAHDDDDVDAALRSGREQADAAGKAAEEWGPLDASLFDRSDHASAPLPLDAFPRPVADWLEAAAGGVVDPGMLAVPMLSYTAAAVGNSREIVTPGGTHREPFGIWGALVGASGTRKSGALKILARAVDPICRDIESKMEPLSIWPEPLPDVTPDGNAKPLPGALAWRLQSITVERAAVDAARNGRGLIIEGDELAGVVQAMSKYSDNGGDRPFYLSGYDAARYSYRRQKDNTTLVVPRNALTLVGGIQPERVAVLLMGGPSDGLASRFVYVYPPPVRWTRDTRSEMDATALESWLRRLLSLMPAGAISGIRSPVPVYLNEGAWKRYADWREPYEAVLFASPENRLREWRSKAAGRVLRFAGTLLLLSWASEWPDAPVPDCIDTVSMDGALAIEAWADAHAVAVYESAGLSQTEADTRIVAAFIRDERLPTFNPHHYRKRPGLRPILHDDRKRREAVLERLVDGCLLKPAPSRFGGGAGRMANDYRVNPSVSGAGF